jgi:hypothetical protein
MISAIFVRSGGLPAAASITSADSRKILRTDRGWCDCAECLRVPAAIVVDPVNGTARNTECLPRTDVDLFSVDSPGKHSVEAIDRSS